MIVGVVGQIASGKDTVAKILEEKGFGPMDFGHEIREFLREKGIETTRENQVKNANEMREKHGADFWARRLASRVEEGKNYVIVSIRNPKEVDALRELKDFVLVKLEAPAELRFGFMQKRLEKGERVKDAAKDLEDFKRMDAAEFSNKDPNAQNIKAVMEMADITISNDGTLDDLKKKVNDLIENS